MYNTEIFELFNQALKQKATPGISYSLHGVKTFEKHYLGFKTYQDLDIVSEDSIYDLASLTKVIATTTRILQLIESKQLSLHDPVIKYLPKFHYSNIKIENLLLHNSGLPADLNNVMTFLDKDAVIRAIYDTNLIYKTGQNMIYSDLNFILLGMIIEKIDGEAFDQSITNNILKPLKMNNSGFNLDKNPRLFVPTEKSKLRGQIQAIVHDETAYKLNGISGNAGLFATLNDLDNFCQMYLNGGSFGGRKILKEDTIAQLFDFNFVGRTLGWQRWNKNDHTLWHTGFTGTSIAIDLDKNTYFVCLTNRVFPTRENKKWLPIRRLAIGLFFQEPELI
ncbi:serine hydrolase [uncultured Lactobacillus sp.]|uniref:serine hydrolase domain-containing protein n=1 Tax=uncultured Lactobacillus sp. TaxID=153152 RepID=UPI00261966BD|nr:serine hydrolase domain-containing protein [uncultured Lactobacillus sp.]